MKRKSIYDDEQTKPLPEEEQKKKFLELKSLDKMSAAYDDLANYIALHNSRLIMTFGDQYKSFISVDDLFAVGYPGIKKAVMGYNPNVNVPFSSYAKLWVETELRRNGYMEYYHFSLSKRENEMVCKYYATARNYIRDYQKEPEFDDIAPFLGLTEKQEEKLRQIISISISNCLDKQIDDDNETTLLERIESYDPNPYSGASIIQGMLTKTEYDMLLAKGEGYSITKIATEFHLEVDEAKKKMDEIIKKVSTKDIYDALHDNIR